MDTSTFEERRLIAKTIAGPMHAGLRHDSAHKHVAGSADYIDDIAEPAGTLLHAALGLTDRAHAEILSMDLSAVEAYPGVVLVLTARDIAENDISPSHLHDEPVLQTARSSFTARLPSR